MRKEPVPEPATLILFASGLAALAAYRKAKK
ncbi:MULTISPECIES: PEP-CTERM sorting domain-containing protein [Desulfosediminicola]